VNAAWEAGDAIKDAYDALAPSYDTFTLGYGYKYETWTSTLLAKAEAEGQRGNRLLDVACGTGFSFIPLLDQGWRVTACDLSAGMVEAARAKVGDRAELLVADMRELPVLGEFDLVWSINTPLNYLLDADELRAALSGMRRNLAPNGMAIFDALTLKTARTFFAQTFAVEREGRKFTWHGELPPEEVRAGATGTGRLVEEGKAEQAQVHRMRHFSEAEILAAIEAAGLDCVEVFGESVGVLQPELDEEAQPIAAYFCRA
jgi:ubiquinone/menaquinone biosynthesis C-methylase UbiE